MKQFLKDHVLTIVWIGIVAAVWATIHLAGVFIRSNL